MRLSIARRLWSPRRASIGCFFVSSARSALWESDLSLTAYHKKDKNPRKEAEKACIYPEACCSSSLRLPWPLLSSLQGTPPTKSHCHHSQITHSCWKWMSSKRDAWPQNILPEGTCLQSCGAGQLPAEWSSSRLITDDLCFLLRLCSEQSPIPLVSGLRYLHRNHVIDHFRHWQSEPAA